MWSAQPSGYANESFGPVANGGVKGGCPPLARLRYQNAVLYTGVVSPLLLPIVIDRVLFCHWQNHPVGCPATHRKIKRVIRWIGICLWPSTRPGGSPNTACAGPGWRAWPGSSCTTRPNQQPGHTGQPLALRPDAGNLRLVDDKHLPPRCALDRRRLNAGWGQCSSSLDYATLGVEALLMEWFAPLLNTASQ